jgi:DmsA/YnfE family anaerobic dimethyl sulfoxide reductase A subunit
MNREKAGHQLSRRSFVKGTALTALAAAAGTGALSSLYACSTTTPSGGGEEVPAPEEKIVWGCCGGRYVREGCGITTCPLQFHVIDGEIAYVESDNTGSSEFGDLQVRACLRGRSLRRWINNPNRLQYPMKRVGKRGEGEFERISWDEAIQILIDKYRYTIETYGNEAVFSNFSAALSNYGRPFERFAVLTGGFLDYYGADSNGQLYEAHASLFGGPGVMAAFSASPMKEALNSDLVVFFGNAPMDTRMGGGSAAYDLARVREAGIRIVSIDPRLSETSSGHPDEWLPIRNGTDAALCSAINYVLISEGLADEDFCHTHCIGYDDTNMPEGAPEHSSYKDYILGTGYDMVAKTPEWAAPITQIPSDKIVQLARDIGNAKAAFISQGWGPQRHSNGENAARSIAMVAIVSGNFGLPGTNNGFRDPAKGGPVGTFSAGENPVKTLVANLSRIDVIERGDQMTALRDGVRGKDKLETSVKFMMNHTCNALFNQHPDLNHTHEVLIDESLCEFICVVDVVMTPSAKYADLLLPECMKQEVLNINSMSNAGAFESVLFQDKVQDPPFECRDFYEVMAEVADAFGVKDAYTDGHETWADWEKALYEQAREARPDLPTLEDGFKMGFWKQETPSYPAYAAFREDPENNPMLSDSGKIEIYSSRLAEYAETWEFDDPRDFISPIPIYNPGYESYEDVTDEFPLVLSGFHPKQRYHSTYADVEILAKAVSQQVWINPVDAATRGINNGDRCKLSSPRGEIEIEAKVTPRIIPGTLTAPEGAWYNGDMNGDKVDKGGNVNVLVSRHWSPLAKHNPSHNSIAQIEKL